MISHRLIVRDSQESLAAAFSAMDHDNDGVISQADFAASFQGTYEMSSESIARLFKKCDLDGDGIIDWSDFLTSACDKRTLVTEAACKEAFASFDHY